MPENTCGQNQLLIHTGNEIDGIKGTFGNFMDEDKNNYFALLTNDDGFVEFNTDNDAAIFVFDHQLNAIKKIALQHNSVEKIRKLRPLSFFKTPEGYLLLCSRYLSSNRSISSFLFFFDNQGQLTRLLQPAVLEDIHTNEIAFPYFDFFEMVTDSACQYVFSFTTPASFDISERINFTIYNENFEVSGNRMLDYPDDFLEYNICEIKSSSGGLFFIRVEIFNPYAPETIVHQIVVYDIIHDDFNSFELKFENAIVQKSALFELENNTIALSGYFVHDKFSEEPQGVFYYLFDGHTGNILKQKIHHFTSEEKESLNSLRLSSITEFKYLQPADIHLTRHNHILLLFEFNWKSVMLIRDREGLLYDKPCFCANEILVFQFDAGNELLHQAAIPKKQAVCLQEEISGFKSFISNNAMYVLYNDHPKNSHQPDAGKLKTMKGKHEMMLGHYDLLTGGFSKAVFSNEKKSFQFNPADVISTHDGGYLFIDKSEKPRLVKIVSE